MITLQSEARYTSRGRDIRVVKAPFEMSRDHPPLIGETIVMDGEPAIIKGVERFMPLRSIGLGEEIALWIEPIDP